MDDVEFKLRMDKEEARLERLSRRVDEGGKRLEPAKALQGRMTRAGQGMDDLFPTQDKAPTVWEPVHPSVWPLLLRWLKRLWGRGARTGPSQPQIAEPAPDGPVLFPQQANVQGLWRLRWAEVCREARNLNAAAVRVRNEADGFCSKLTQVEEEARQSRTVRYAVYSHPRLARRRKRGHWLSAVPGVIWSLVTGRAPTRRPEVQVFQDVTLNDVLDRRLFELGPSLERLNIERERLPKEWKALSEQTAELGKTLGA